MREKRYFNYIMSFKWRMLILFCIDTVFIIGAFILTGYLKTDYFFRYEVLFPSYFFISYLILIILIHYFLGLYKSIWRYANLKELLNVVVATLIDVMCLKILGIIFDFYFSNSYLIIYFIVLAFALNGIRIIYRLLRHVKNSRNHIIQLKSKVLIIGAGDAGYIVVNELKDNLQYGKEVLGFIDDNIEKLGRKIRGVKILGTREDIIEICKRNLIDEIIIAMPSANKKEMIKILEICKKTHCKVKTIPGVYELIDGKVGVNQIRDIEIEDLLDRDPILVDLSSINSYLQEKTVLVTGGGGSIGSELCRQIARYKPKKLVILDIYENNAYDLQQELKFNYQELNLDVIIGSVRDFDRMCEVFKSYQPDVVYHAAAHKHVPLMEDSPGEAIKNNVFGTYNVAKCSDLYQVKRFVLVSTDKAVNPTNIMGATKRLAEMIIQAFNANSQTEYVAVRFGNVLGSNGSVIPLFKKQIAQGGPVTVTHPDIIRYFMTIPEAVQLILQAGTMARGGEIFILDMGKPVKILDLAKNLIELSGFTPDVDIKIEFSGLRPGEKMYEELLMKEEGLQQTKNKKIFVAKPTFENLEIIEQYLNELTNVIELKGSIKEIMKRIVKTYHEPIMYESEVEQSSQSELVILEEDNSYVITSKNFKMQQKIKIIYEKVLAFLALVILSPLLLLIALLIKIKLGGPVIFKQERIGLNGRSFYLYKFRTMTNQRDESGMLLPDHERLTSFGSWLRKTSLDELPELINILKGEMSIVGPRPLLPEYLPLYSQKQMLRHLVLPGLTGWAQINGRNAITWSKKFELDVDYVENFSLWHDFKIILLTFKNLIKQDDVNQSEMITMEKFNGLN